MPFTIPNQGNAAFQAQAAPDSTDIEALQRGDANTGVITGCAVAAQAVPDMTVAVAAGSILSAGVFASVTAGNATITAAHATLPRKDIVVASAAGALSVVAGAAATVPVKPAIPAGSIILAEVYVPAADTAINANQIIDKRVELNSDAKVADGKLAADAVTTYPEGTSRVWADSGVPGWPNFGEVLTVRDGNRGFQLLQTVHPQGSMVRMRSTNDVDGTWGTWQELSRVGHTHAKADLPAAVAYEDEANTFTQVLSVQNHIYSVMNLHAQNGTPADVRIGDRGPAQQAGITFGDALDTNLYRAAANHLKTDDQFSVEGRLNVAGDQINLTGAGATYINSSGTSLAYDTPVTGSGYLWQAGGVTIMRLAADGKLIFGSLADTNLYRAAADQLKTDDALDVVGALTKGGVAVSLEGHTHAQLHNRLHSITDALDHTFPGGTTTFLRADGTFTAPPDFWTTLTKSADQSTTLSSLVSDTELTFSVVAAGVYAVDFLLVYSSSSQTGDWVGDIFVEAPGGGGTMSPTGWSRYTASDSAADALVDAATRLSASDAATPGVGIFSNSINGIVLGGATGGPTRLMRGSAMFVANVAGTVTVKFHGGGATAAVKQGTTLRYKRLV